MINVNKADSIINTNSKIIDKHREYDFLSIFTIIWKRCKLILCGLIILLNSQAMAQNIILKNDFYQSVRTKMNTVTATNGISVEFFQLADINYFINSVDKWLVGVAVDQEYLRNYSSFFTSAAVADQGLTQEKSTWTAMVTPREAKYNGFIILSVFNPSGTQGTEFHEAIHAFSLSKSLGDMDADVHGGPEFLSNGFLSILQNLRNKDAEINNIINGLQSGNNMTTEITAFWRFINHLESLYNDATRPPQVVNLLNAIKGKADWAGYRAKVEKEFIKARESFIPDNWYVNCRSDFSVVAEEGLTSERMAGPFRNNVAANGWIILNCPSRVCDKNKKCPNKKPEKGSVDDEKKDESRKDPKEPAKDGKKPDKKPEKTPETPPVINKKCEDLDKNSTEWLENCQDKEEVVPEVHPDLTLEFTCGDSFELSPNEVLYPKTCYVIVRNATSTHDRVELEVSYESRLLDITFDKQSETAKSPANTFLLIIRTRVPVPALMTTMTIVVKHGVSILKKTVDVSILSPGIEPSSGEGIRPPAIVANGSGGEFCVWRDKSFGDPPECFNISTAKCTNSNYVDKPRYELVGSNMTWSEAGERSFDLSRFKGNAYNCEPFKDEESDKDHDTIIDVKDNCPTMANKNQHDADKDGIGDVCDNDFDNDSIPNHNDNCPATKNADQKDIDADGKGDVCDNNSDNDDVLDFDDNCRLMSNPTQADLDNDGIGDACDNDMDGDGKDNNSDNCPLIKNSGQLDKDADGLGDFCDNDKDGDGKLNGEDNCEDVYNPDQKNSDEHWMGDACASPVAKDDLSGVDCSAYQGMVAVWDEDKNTAGCSCPGSLDWSDALNRCASERETALASANCSSYGKAKAVWDETTSQAMCECVNGYEFNDKNQCVASGIISECSDYPGTTFRNNQCICPGDLEWSDTKNQCVNNSDLSISDVDCTAYPGSFPQFDMAANSWKCACMGSNKWSSALNRCASSEDEAVAGADCSRLKGTTAVYDDFVGAVVCKCINSNKVLSDSKGSCMTAAEAEVADYDCSHMGIGGVSFYDTSIGKASCKCKAGFNPNDDNTACLNPTDVAGTDSSDDEDLSDVETVDAGSGTVSSRAVNICVTDSNSVLDDHFKLMVNGNFIGTITNPEGGTTCYDTVLNGGSNSIQLILIKKMGKSTALTMNINNEEYTKGFSGSHNHVWEITAPF